eukprot:2054086-Amphidinium_carterae.2
MQLAVAAGMPSFADLLQTICLEKNMQWKVAGSLSTPRTTRRGTPQGCALSVLLFQLAIAPVARAVRLHMQAKCPGARLLVYADDFILIAPSAERLEESMQLAAQLLESLDFSVNVLKSCIFVLGPARLPQVVINSAVVPISDSMDVLGSTLVPPSTRLVAPNALPTSTSSRTVARWIKVKERLARLERLPITSSGKHLLWRTVILPVTQYDAWSLVPTKAAAESWSTLICRSIYTGVRGKRDRQLLAAFVPHQEDLLSLMFHQLARELWKLVPDEPLIAFFTPQLPAAISSPLNAFTRVAVMLGFQLVEDGLLMHGTQSSLSWPPES